jgi:hypothetical protein
LLLSIAAAAAAAAAAAPPAAAAAAAAVETAGSIRQAPDDVLPHHFSVKTAECNNRADNTHGHAHLVTDLCKRYKYTVVITCRV